MDDPVLDPHVGKQGPARDHFLPQPGDVAVPGVVYRFARPRAAAEQNHDKLAAFRLRRGRQRAARAVEERAHAAEGQPGSDAQRALEELPAPYLTTTSAAVFGVGVNTSVFGAGAGQAADSTARNSSPVFFFRTPR